MFIVLSQVNYVIDGKAYQNDDGNRLRDAKLPPLKNHDRDHAEYHYSHANNGQKGDQYIASYARQDNERKYKGNDDALNSWLKESLLGDHPWQENTSVEFSTLKRLWSIQ